MNLARHTPTPRALLGCAILLSACSGGDTSAPAATPPAASRSLGLMEITINGIGGNLSSTPRMYNGGPQPRAFDPFPRGIDVKQYSASTVDRDGFRYITVVYQVRNAGVCATPDTCPVYTSATNNLTLVAADTASNILDTALTQITLFDGSNPAATQTLATSLVPADGEMSDGSGVQPGQESLQVFTESEVAGIPLDTGAVSLFPYGYVVRNVNSGSSRSLPASPAAGQYDGQVSFSFKLPLQPVAADNPYSVSLIFQVVDDSNTRVTESLEEQSSGVPGAPARAAALGSTDLAVLGGHPTQTNIGNPICSVRTAGTAAAPTAYLANNSGATLASTPYNLQPQNKLFNGVTINSSFCTPMNAATFGTMTIDGSISGRRTLNGPASGTFSQNAAGTSLTFKPNSGHPFINGETVSYSFTNGLKSSGGASLSPFTGSFTVMESLPSEDFLFDDFSLVAGNAPQVTLAADFNGDGVPDFATTNAADNTVSILVGHSVVASPATGTAPRAMVAGDFNEDGHIGLAVANFGSADVSVILNLDGHSNFLPLSRTSVGANPVAIVTGDFDGDGHLDLAVANQGSGTVSILLGGGGGSFVIASTVTVGGSPQSLAVGDFDGDGHPDLVVTSTGPSAISILHNIGGGHFSVSGVTVPQFITPGQVLVGDFNGDGLPDFAVSGNNVGILLNNGHGGFTGTSNSLLPVGAQFSALGDMNGDGTLDLAEMDSQGELTLLFGDGHGGFLATPLIYQIGSPGIVTTSLTAADYNNQGIMNLIVTSSSDSRVYFIGQN